MKSLKLLLRFVIVGGLVLLLMVPLLLIRGAVGDRVAYREQAVRQVSESTAGPQQLVGPLRIVPYRETRTIDEVADGKTVKKTETVEGYLYQEPASLQVGGTLKPDTRKLGLYAVRVFEWQADLQAAFDPLPLPATPGRNYGEPYLVLGLADVRGLVGTPDFRIDGQPLALKAGTRELGERMNGVHGALPQTPGTGLPASRLNARFRLAGTQALGIAPIADSNRIGIASSWPHPLFGGKFLPNARKIDAGGFNASWEISSLASAAQGQMKQVLEKDEGSLTARSLNEDYGKDGEPVAMVEASGIDSVDIGLASTADVYTQVDRASKYGILFVVLTFVGFALFELIKRLPIHPLQYLLVGLALAIFFLLLLSLSEHIAFWKAYLLSAAACIGLQFFYLSGVLKSWWRAAGFAAMLTALYGVLYSLLVMEDSALLMGSLMLFGILAAIMWITRKVDWYDVVASLR